MPGPSGPSPKLIGQLAAIGLGVVFIVIILLVMRHQTAPRPAPTTGRDFSQAPDITDVETGQSIELTLVDRDNPDRVASVIEADTLDPLGGGLRLLTNPRAWIYLDGDRAVRVTADQARLMMPANETPESGTLEGSVLVRVYESAGTPGTPPPDGAEPILTATFDQPVRFERRYMRLSSPGGFRIVSAQVDFDGEDLTVILNEVQRRLERLDVQRGGRMVIRTGGLPDAKAAPPVEAASIADPNLPDTSQPDPAVASAGETPAATVTELTEDTPADTGQTIATDTPLPTTPALADTPKVDRYTTVFHQTVVVTLGTTRAEADRLDLHTRLTNNQLPPDAIARVGFARTPAPTPSPSAPEPSAPASDADAAEPLDGVSADEPLATTPPTTDADASTAEPAPPPPDAPPTGPVSDDLVLTWTGPMTVRPVDTDEPDENVQTEPTDAADISEPDPLAEDDAALTMHADEGNTVRVTDEAAGVRAEGGVLRYFASRAVLDFDPIADRAVTIAMDESGDGRFARVRADLRRGHIDLAGPATIRSDDAVIDYTRTGRLTLATDADGNLTDRLTRARFEGDVDAAQEGGQILADTLDTEFALDDAGATTLRVATLTDGSISAASESDTPARGLAAETIRVEFLTENGGTDPSRVVAAGSVYAEADGAVLEADHADAALHRDAAGQIGVREARADGRVRYAAADDTRAEGDALRVDGINETIRITGPEAAIAQGDSTILGPRIDLDARTRRMTVEGAGRFEHTLRDPEGLPNGMVVSTWSDSMRFDDALGRLNAAGDVTVVSTPDAFTRDTLSAQRVEVEITPQLGRDSIDGRGPVERELLAARAYGDSSADRARPATVETRRYDPADPERVTGLLYLEGDQITADTVRNTLRVPGAGTLLVMDRRDEGRPITEPVTEPAPARPQGPDPLGGSAGPGLTRFTWLGSFDLDRASGIAVMEDGVLVRHKTIAAGANAGQIADLATDRLTAGFAESDDAENPFALRTAEALGSVVFRATGKVLTADGANYDAATDVLHALALPGRFVELQEPGRPAPLSARAIMWDLARDRIEINRPSPVTLPN